ncbi:unnamed protein product [Umbelopsis ramanniana]
MASWNNVSHNNDFITTPILRGVILPLADGVSFLVNGGETTPRNTSEVNQTTIFNTENRTWSALNITNITQATERRAVVDSFGKFWFWGGYSDYSTGYNNLTYYGAFNTLYPSNWVWSNEPSASGQPYARTGHSMTMAADGNIYIIGGISAYPSGTVNAQNISTWVKKHISLSEIARYNTYYAQWNTVNAIGSQQPQSRSKHTATLAADGTSIIVFGGASFDDNSTPLNDLYTYDTVSNSWSNKTVEGGPSARYDHSAVLVNSTMFIMFGYDSAATYLSDIYALDTLNWNWTNYFDPSGYAADIRVGGLSTGAIAGITVGAGLLVIAATSLVFFCLCRRRNRKFNYKKEDNENLQAYPMQEKPMPPKHEFIYHPEEKILGDHSQAEHKGASYEISAPEKKNSMNGTPELSSIIGTSTLNYSTSHSLGSGSPEPGGNGFSDRKSHDLEIPFYVLRLNKPNEDE